jgi:hypothetical protein
MPLSDHFVERLRLGRAKFLWLVHVFLTGSLGSLKETDTSATEDARVFPPKEKCVERIDMA